MYNEILGLDLELLKKSRGNLAGDNLTPPELFLMGANESKFLGMVNTLRLVFAMVEAAKITLNEQKAEESDTTIIIAKDEAITYMEILSANFSDILQSYLEHIGAIETINSTGSADKNVDKN
jgi:hypothetical protein